MTAPASVLLVVRPAREPESARWMPLSILLVTLVLLQLGVVPCGAEHSSGPAGSVSISVYGDDSGHAHTALRGSPETAAAAKARISPFTTREIVLALALLLVAGIAILLATRPWHDDDGRLRP